MKNRALGKGLSALISESKIDFISNKNNINRDEVDIKLLSVGKYQPRKYFDQKDLEDLAQSIKTNGIISPIIVRETEGQRYEIIAGERRWRASKLAGLSKVPVIIRKLTDKEALEFAIIENIQRRDLNIIEEAASYRRLMDEFKYTQEQMSEALGKSRSHIANLMRMLSLPEFVKDQINEGNLSIGHAKILASTESPESMARVILNDNLTVRQAEKFIKGQISTPNKNNLKVRIRSFDESEIIDSDEDKKSTCDIALIEEKLTNSLGHKVTIEHNDVNNKIIIHLENIRQLEKILHKFDQ